MAPVATKSNKFLLYIFTLFILLEEGGGGSR